MWRCEDVDLFPSESSRSGSLSGLGGKFGKMWGGGGGVVEDAFRNLSLLSSPSIFPSATTSVGADVHI